jgi:hypothetical protein
MSKTVYFVCTVSCRVSSYWLQFVLYTSMLVSVTLCAMKLMRGKTRGPLQKGTLSTADFLVVTNLDQLIFILKILFTFVLKQATFMRRSTVLKFPL